MEGKCRSEDIIYKCVVTATGHPRKVYLGTAEGDFKQRYYNHKKSFRNRKYANETSLSKYIWEMKDKHNRSPNLMWCIVRSVPGYSNISKICKLCLHKKYEILNYPDQQELFNKTFQNLYQTVGMLTSFFSPIINQMISVSTN